MKKTGKLRRMRRIYAIMLAFMLMLTCLPILPVRAEEVEPFTFDYGVTEWWLTDDSRNVSIQQTCVSLEWWNTLTIQVDSNNYTVTGWCERSIRKNDLNAAVQKAYDANYEPSAIEDLKKVHREAEKILSQNQLCTFTGRLEPMGMKNGNTIFEIEDIRWENDEEYVWNVNEFGAYYLDSCNEHETITLTYNPKLERMYIDLRVRTMTDTDCSSAPGVSTLRKYNMFQFYKDTFSFTGSPANFNITEEKKSSLRPAFDAGYGRHLTDTYVDMLLKDLPSYKQAWLLSCLNDWFKDYSSGMSSVAGQMYMDKIKLSEFDETAEKAYDLWQPSTNEKLQTAIVYHQLLRAVYLFNEKFSPSNTIDIDELYKYVKQYLLRPTLIEFSFNDELGAQSVLAYDAKEFKSGRRVIRCYDPMNMGDPLEITISPSGKVFYSNTDFNDAKIIGYARVNENYNNYKKFVTTQLDPIHYDLARETAYIVTDMPEFTVYSAGRNTTVDRVYHEGSDNVQFLQHVNTLNNGLCSVYKVKYVYGEDIVIKRTDKNDIACSFQLMTDYGDGGLNVLAEGIMPNTKLIVSTNEDSRGAEIIYQENGTYRLSFVDTKIYQKKSAIAVEGDGKGVEIVSNKDGISVKTPDKTSVDVMPTDIATADYDHIKIDNAKEPKLINEDENGKTTAVNDPDTSKFHEPDDSDKGDGDEGDKDDGDKGDTDDGDKDDGDKDDGDKDDKDDGDKGDTDDGSKDDKDDGDKGDTDDGGKDDGKGDPPPEPPITRMENEITAPDWQVTYETYPQKIQLIYEQRGDAPVTFESNTSGIKVNKKGVVTIPAKYFGEVYITIAASTTQKYWYTSTKVRLVCCPQPTKIKSIKSPSRGQIKLNWKKISHADGYEIQYATNKKFNNAKTLYIKSKKTTSKTFKNKKSGKTYYFKIRAYKKKGGWLYLSPACTVKKIKVK